MALIRCKSCNNPISSRLATCPFCGAAVTDDVAQQGSAPVANTLNEAAAAPQKTLNDILAERKAQPTTVNEIHTTPVAEPVAKPKSQPTSQTLYGGEYDQNERILDDY